MHCEQSDRVVQVTTDKADQREWVQQWAGRYSGGEMRCGDLCVMVGRKNISCLIYCPNK